MINRLMLLAVLMLAVPVPGMAAVRNVQDNHLVTYNVIDSSGDHVTGQTVTLKIMRAADGYWFDFDDSTFKNSSWTSKSANLSEDSTEGRYYYAWNPPGSETGAQQYLFCVDNSDATYGDHQCETVDYQVIGSGTSTHAAADVWSVATRTLTAGTNISLAKGTGVTGFNDIAATDVWAAGTRTLTAIDEDSTTLDLNGTTVGGLTTWDKTDYALSTTSINAVADQVWDEAISGHLGAGSTGAALNAAGSAGDPWTTPLPGAYGAGTAGYIVGTNLNATVSSRSTLTAANVWETNISAYSGAGYAGTYAKAIYDKLPAANMLSSGVWTDAKAGYLDEAISGIDDNPWDNATRTLTALDEDTTTIDLNGSNVGGLTTWDKTGYSLSSSQTFNLTGNITGNLSGSVGSVTGAVGSVTGAVGSVTSGVTVTTNNDKTGYALSAAGIDAIWDEAQSGHTTAGTFGYYLDSQVSTAGGGGLTAAAIADAVWDEAISGHLTSGTTGSKLNSAASAGDPWSTDISSGYTGQAGEYLRQVYRLRR